MHTNLLIDCKIHFKVLLRCTMWPFFSLGVNFLIKERASYCNLLADASS